MNKNLPNELTMLRVICVPVFVIMLLLNNRYTAAIIFVLASLTDYLDGILARKFHCESNFGKLMDPLADKILVAAALICLTKTGEIYYICTLIVIIREFAISSIRLVALEKGMVIAASYWGKFKTASQMISIVMILFKFYEVNSICFYITYGLFYISTVLVVISLIDYIYKSRELFKW